MTNYPFESIETFNDVAVVNEYNIVKSQGGNVEELLHKHKMENRDNSRTPMQWDDSTNAGFSEHKPWFPVNPNYTTINVEQQQQDKDSILNFYKQLIQLKKSDELFTYGQFKLVDVDNPDVFAYSRIYNNKKVIVIGNLTDQTTSVTLTTDVTEWEVLLHNYKEHSLNFAQLRPYEACVIEVK
jgi:alpha-glucosidase